MRIQHQILLSSAILASFTSLTPAMASYKPSVTPLSVYPGCEAPKTVSGANTFYVDPTNGLDTNDGSQAKPWKTLATVLNSKIANDRYRRSYGTYKGELTAVNPSGPVRPGDTILLMGGNYGAVSLAGVNKAFITLKAAPGQTPLFTQLTVQGANRWVIQGLKVQGTTARAAGTLVNISAHGNVGPDANIIFDGNHVSTVDDSSTWTPQDFQDKAAFRGIGMAGSMTDPNAVCLSVTNNMITNIQRGAGVFAKKSLFAGNTIDTFGGGDGMSFAADDILISNNYITNAIQRVTENHIDAMQGQQGSTESYSNVVIDRNVVVRQSKPGIVTEPSMQGISAFDSDWNNLTVTNNVVVTSTYHGMAWGAINNALIANNTVVNDGLTTNKKTWLNVSKGKSAYHGSKDVVIRNNIAGLLIADLTIPNISVDNNVTEYASFVKPDKIWRYTKPGIYEGNNKVVANLASNFVNYSPATFTYDLNLLPNSSLVNSGSSAQAPSYDQTGRTRLQGVDLGALEVLPKEVVQPGTGNTINASSGVITVKANARQKGTPTLVVSVDGNVVGSAVVKADGGLGQTAVYSFDYKATAKPQKVTLAVQGFGGTTKYDSVGVFNVVYDPAGPAKLDVLKASGLAKVQSGQVNLTAKGGQYLTNGAITFDVSGVK